jgi:sialidase-1
VRTLLAGVSSVLLARSPVQSADAKPTPKPFFDQQVLFEAANEQGYSCFRIPAIVRSGAERCSPSPRGGWTTAATPATSTWC